MAWKPQHKLQTRERILTSAAELFTHQGFDHVAIDQVMHHAGLTRGAFYAHFKNKSELYAEAIVFGARAKAAQIRPDTALNDIACQYLSAEHLHGQQKRCPLAFLTTDISQRDSQVRDAYTRVFDGLVKRIELGGLSRERALQQAVLMVGGAAIANALNNETLIDDLLTACRKMTPLSQT
ncbi:TetR/AcrR family transcriptional regulator [Neptunicella marina]|uniref:TetR family transcriptional regulator n=1 Tax=Neptunicella marina TaxID=2125989 RepID=A0A8J6LZE1_9ALTE|nr:TetR family transcriptional regulator [Neptunicella marina]MBC3766055.1 TetR family transcriptional regulator [Neptunicella marina]